MTEKKRREREENSLRNCGITVGILGIATVFCFLLQRFVTTDTHVPLLFVLAVLFISRLTDGYRYGIIASLIAVVGVNFVFTYPYFELDFTIVGYPLTFIAMLAVSLCVSALTTQIKHQEQVRLLAEKEKMRSNLLRAVSHDIRTPLTSIIASASGILENQAVLGEQDKLELVSDIREEAQWLIRIVENLLSVTRIHEENAQIQKSEEVVEEVIGSAIAKFSRLFLGIAVSVEMPEDVLLVPMDGILIEQVLVNLMENSVLHGKTTQRIQIIVEQRTDRVMIAVADDGEGIDAAVLPVMFEGELTQRDGTASDTKRNMGIGLSVCMSIVKAHQGGMCAENLPERGAKVTFWLPKEDEE